MKPIILTAGDDKFKDIISISVDQIKKFNYTPLVYDLGNLGLGQPYHKETKVTLRNPKLPWDELLASGRRVGRQVLLNRRASAPWKPQLILDAMNSLNEWNHLMWIDGDVIITQTIDEIFRNDYDVAVTLRTQKGKHIQSRYLNIGVLVFRNTPQGIGFLKKWCEAQEENPKECDQRIMHFLLEKEDTGISITKAWKNISFLGAKVLLLPSAIYNHTIGNPSRIDLALERNSKIWHLKASYYPHKKDLKDLFLKEVSKKCKEYSHEIS